MSGATFTTKSVPVETVNVGDTVQTEDGFTLYRMTVERIETDANGDFTLYGKDDGEDGELYFEPAELVDVVTVEEDADPGVGIGGYRREAKAIANAEKLDRAELIHIVATVTRWMDTEGAEDESVNGGDLVDGLGELLDSFELFEPKGEDAPAEPDAEGGEHRRSAA
jgi:hypothetical protein